MNTRNSLIALLFLICSIQLFAQQDRLTNTGGGKANTFVKSRVIHVDLNGVNSSAQKGREDLPYHEPWTAIQHASKGDIIYINAGTYSFSNLGGGGTFEAPDAQSASLWKDSVIIYAEPGVTFVNETDTAIYRLFVPDTVGAKTTLIVKGQASFIDKTYLISASNNTNGTRFNVDFEFDEIDITGNYASPILCQPCEKARFVGKKVVRDSPRETFWFRGSLYSGDTFPSNIYVGLDYLQIDSSQYSAGSGDLGVLNANRHFIYSKIVYDVKNMDMVSSGWKSVFSIGGWAAHKHYTHTRVNIGNLRYRDVHLMNGDYASYDLTGTQDHYSGNTTIQSYRLNTLFPIYWDNNPEVSHNTYDFYIGNFYGDASVTGHQGVDPDVSSRNMFKANIRVGNAISPNGHPLVGGGVARPRSDTTHSINVHFDKAHVVNGPAGFFENEEGILNVSGNYSNSGNFPVFLFEGGSLGEHYFFDNVTAQNEDDYAHTFEANQPYILKVGDIKGLETLTVSPNITLDQLPTFGGGGSADGDGILDPTNDGESVPAGMNVALTDSLVFDNVATFSSIASPTSPYRFNRMGTNTYGTGTEDVTLAGYDANGHLINDASIFRMNSSSSAAGMVVTSTGSSIAGSYFVTNKSGIIPFSEELLGAFSFANNNVIVGGLYNYFPAFGTTTTQTELRVGPSRTSNTAQIWSPDRSISYPGYDAGSQDDTPVKALGLNADEKMVTFAVPSGGSADGNGILSAANDNGTVSTSMTLNITDSLVLKGGQIIVNNSDQPSDAAPIDLSAAPFVFMAEDGDLKGLSALSPYGQILSNSHSVHFPRTFTYASGGTTESPTRLSATQGIYDLRTNTYGSNDAYNIASQFSIVSVDTTSNGRNVPAYKIAARRVDDGSSTLLVNSDNEFMGWNEDGVGTVRIGKNGTETFMFKPDSLKAEFFDAELFVEGKIETTDTINFRGNTSRILGQTQMQIEANSGGSSIGRIILSGNTAVPLQIRDINPSDVAVYSGLAFSFDSQSNFTAAPGTGFLFSVPGANMDIDADTVKLVDLPNQPWIRNNTYVLTADQNGHLEPSIKGLYSDTTLSVTNGNILSFGTIFADHETTTIESIVNTSASTDNTLLLGTATTAMLGHKIVVTNSDTDTDPASDDYDTALSATSPISLNGKTVSGYMLARGETVTLTIANVGGSPAFVISSSSIRSGNIHTITAAAPTLQLERGIVLQFNAATQGLTTNTLGTSDLEHGDELQIVIVGANGGNDSTLDLDFGNIVWDNLSGDATETFNQARHSFTATWDDVNELLILNGN